MGCPDQSSRTAHKVAFLNRNRAQSYHQNFYKRYEPTNVSRIGCTRADCRIFMASLAENSYFETNFSYPKAIMPSALPCVLNTGVYNEVNIPSVRVGRQ